MRKQNKSHNTRYFHNTSYSWTKENLPITSHTYEQENTYNTSYFQNISYLGTVQKYPTSNLWTKKKITYHVIIMNKIKYSYNTAYSWTEEKIWWHFIRTEENNLLTLHTYKQKKKNPLALSYLWKEENKRTMMVLYRLPEQTDLHTYCWSFSQIRCSKFYSTAPHLPPTSTPTATLFLFFLTHHDS